MRLVFIYGPPGVGKLTVATALATLTGYRLCHNHLTVNLVTALFPPNTAAWDRLPRASAWRCSTRLCARMSI